MDPLSVSASAAALVTICVQTVQTLKRVIENLKGAKGVSLKLLSQTERVRLFLEQLRSLTKQVGTRSEILLAYNDSAPRATINEFNALVHDIARRGKVPREISSVQQLFLDPQGTQQLHIIRGSSLSTPWQQCKNMVDLGAYLCKGAGLGCEYGVQMVNISPRCWSI